MPTTSAAARRDIIVDIAIQDPAWEKVEGVNKTIEHAVRTSIQHATTPHLEDDRPLELSIVLANNDLVQVLNREYRGKDKPTNVLTFAALDDETSPDHGGPISLGDVFLALETLLAEAKDQQKPFGDHLKHLCVHGTLHLLGYDHLEEDEANIMETLEIRILQKLGVQNPYIDPLDMA